MTRSFADIKAADAQLGHVRVWPHELAYADRR
jgi:hypothetical protein